MQGVEGIRKVFIREAKRTTVDAGGSGSYRTENEWMLDTEGVNLLSVMCHPDVDYTRTVSNHLIEIIDVLGIEAGRNALMKVRFACRQSARSIGHMVTAYQLSKHHADHSIINAHTGDSRCD